MSPQPLEHTAPPAPPVHVAENGEYLIPVDLGWSDLFLIREALNRMVKPGCTQEHLHFVMARVNAAYDIINEATR